MHTSIDGICDEDYLETENPHRFNIGDFSCSFCDDGQRFLLNLTFYRLELRIGLPVFLGG